MNHKTSSSSPALRAYRIVLVTLAALGLAFAVFVLRRAFVGSFRMVGHLGWEGLFSTWNGVGLLTLGALPLSALAVWWTAQRRRAAGVPSAWRMSVAEVGLVHGTVPWVIITLQPGARAGEVPGTLSLVPLRDLLTMDTGQIVGNLLVFAALGFLAPQRFTALASVPRVLGLAAGCSVLIEIAQYVLQLDRVSSVDDVLLNASGAALAALASRPWWRTATGAPSERPRPALASTR
ncbi:VanZ family protein [Streptomyces sp. Da 82-17]|uniref:VanZ family protein n=1 Tax=Streptomyces sp. Da 82-17 TaxID=3377116 RepID=UPI0038D4DDBE